MVCRSPVRRHFRNQDSPPACSNLKTVWPDIYVTNNGKNRLYHNNHDGTFTDVAEKAGVTVGTWSTGATFGDYDGDGRLDLFVAGYARLDLGNL